MRAPGSPLPRLALWAIRLYQRHLSPIKGFSCAYRVASGGASCSAYGYRAIERHGLVTGLALLDRRLQRCGAAHRSRSQPRNPVLHYQRGDCDCFDCGDVSCGSPCDGGGRDFPGPRSGGSWRSCRSGLRCDPWRRWRQGRWLDRAADLQRERLEREQRERMARERQEREQNTQEPKP